jgi:quinoprotein relay system zinc metallohydrolase 1
VTRDASSLSRRHTLALGAAALTSSALWLAEVEAAPLAYDLKPLKLADGVWMLAGAQENIDQTNGGAIANIAILNSDAGAIIIDTGPSRKFGEAVRDLAKQLTKKDIARVYVTHFHPDHIFGNQAFDPQIIATTEKVAKGVEVMGNGFSDAMYRTAGDWMRGTEVVVPGKILTDSVEDFGDRRIRPLPMRGHTDSDLVLFDEKSGFLFTGDLVFLDRAPTTPHANIENWRISLAKLGGIPHAGLMPGHGPVEPSDRGIDQTRDWLEAIEKIVKDAFDEGLDMTEAMALPLPAFTNKIALARHEFVRTVMHLYPRLESERWPRVDDRG